jgi:hypothetical protein
MAVLRSVSKSDTLEKQRQIINLIGQDLFTTTAGDSDLAAGELKLGDGTRPAPSLAFSSQPSLGLYKPDSNILGITTSGGDAAFFSDQVSFFKTTKAIRKALFTGGLSISDDGNNYGGGTYSEVALTGGLGSAATANITVDHFQGTLDPGTGYTAGDYTGVLLVGSATGSGALASFSVAALDGTITNGGAGYTDKPAAYCPFTTITGSGSNADGYFQIVNGEIINVTVLNGGSGYQLGDVLGVNPNGGAAPLSATYTDIGTPTTEFEFVVGNTPGIINNFVVTDSGTGYQLGDTVEPAGNLTLPVNRSTATQTLLVTGPSAKGVLIGSTVTGTGIPADTTVDFVDLTLEPNVITISQAPTSNGNGNVTIVQPYGSGGGDFTIDDLGAVSAVEIVNGGAAYEPLDVLSANAEDLAPVKEYTVATSTFQELTFSSNHNAIVGQSIDPGQGLGTPMRIYAVLNSTSLIMELGGNVAFGTEFPCTLLETGASLTTSTAAQPVYDRFIINNALPEDLTLYAGSKYRFDYSLAGAFGLSKVVDGTNTNVTKTAVTIVAGSSTITMADTSGIVADMEVSINSGTGALVPYTCVLSVDSGTQITLKDPVVSDGVAELYFSGVAYDTTEFNDTGILEIKFDGTTTPDGQILHPFNPDGAGFATKSDGTLAEVTVEHTNPNTFGSGLQINVNLIDSISLLQSDVFSGTTTISDLAATNANVTSGVFDTVSGTTATYTTGALQNITHPTSVTLTSPSFVIDADLNLGSSTTYVESTTTLSTANFVAQQVQVDSGMFLDNQKLYASAGNDLTIEVPADRTIKHVGGALTLPTGDIASRPTVYAELGSIRFNTETSSYEGYLGLDGLGNPQWSSLGGVRDIDGNTEILAELTTGANDNILWFYNDGNNTLKLSNDFMEFRECGKIRAVDPNTPDFIEWTPNTFVDTNAYVKYENNLFLVVSGGVTGSLSTPPADLSGSDFTHGTATFRWNSIAVRDLIITETTALKIGPTGNVPLIISEELKLQNNIFESLTDDINIKPAADKKVKVDALTSFVIPSGTEGQRGIAEQGSIRYNTTITQFEGYNGNSWSSLGGVRDVDGDTYIKPETSAGSDEDTLYFYNQDSNTLRITLTAFEFNQVDTITSDSTNNLNVAVVATNFGPSLETSINHADDGLFQDRAHISTTKGALELGVSAGLTNYPMFRINDSGEFQSNALALSGIAQPLWATLTDIQGTQLNQRDYSFSTSRVELTKGVTNTFTITAYDNQTVDSCIIEIQAFANKLGGSTTTYEKDYIQFVVTDNRTDILYNEISTLQTGANLLQNIGFQYENPNAGGQTAGNIRVTGELDDSLTNGDIVRVVVVKRQIKNLAQL